jgi:hypothetical protein
MKSPIQILISLLCAIALFIVSSSARAAEERVNEQVTTADIADGIQKHINERTKAGAGYFHLRDGEKDLSLTLERIHNDKLTSLSRTKHFACVDMRGTDGNLYDVDFFLKGHPGAMTVSETAVHKVNGKPRYNWKQGKNGVWHKVAIRE